MTFEAQTQFKRGKYHEAELDDHFAEYYEIIPTGRDLERAGFGDRLFINSETGQQFFVEYKSDESTFRTGNLFIETISVDDPSNFKKGWAFTCRCDILLYYLPLNNEILIFRMQVIKEHIDQWRKEFPEVKTGKRQNKTYDTHGVLLPLDIAKKYTESVRCIDGSEYTDN